MSLVMSDGRKYRRTWMLPLTFLGPFGVTLMGVILFVMRRADLMEAVAANGAWRAVMDELGVLDVAAIALGITLLASMAFDVDHRSGTWKQLFALPVSRAGLYLTKLGIVAALLALASVLAALGVAGLYVAFGLGELPWEKLALLAVLPWIGALPLIAWQGALSAHFRNQAIAITAGVAGVVVSLFGESLPSWLPWAPPVESVRWLIEGRGDLPQILAFATATTIAIAAVGAVAFAKREVM